MLGWGVSTGQVDPVHLKIVINHHVEERKSLPTFPTFWCVGAVRALMTFIILLCWWLWPNNELKIKCWPVSYSSFLAALHMMEKHGFLSTQKGIELTWFLLWMQGIFFLQEILRCHHFLLYPSLCICSSSSLKNALPAIFSSFPWGWWEWPRQCGKRPTLFHSFQDQHTHPHQSQGCACTFHCQMPKAFVLT